MLRNFGYVLDGKLAGLAHPVYAGDVAEGLRELHEHGITAVVSLDTSGLPEGSAAASGLDHLHLPVTDFEPPTIGQADEFVAYVDHHLSRGGQVAAHCGAGIGRTGTMLAAYLISIGMTVDEAIALLRERRPGSVETASQHRFLEEFANHRS
jgi:atypical dual specificity phosphatase